MIVITNLPGGLVRQMSTQSSFGTFDNGGEVELDSGLLSFNSFTSEPTATCRWLLSGPAPAVGSGTLSAGYLGLDGILAVGLTNGFMPGNGNAFLLVTNQFRNGQFASASLPSLSSNLNWHLQYTSTALTLLASSPVVLSGAAHRSDGSFQFTLTGGDGSSYEIQASTNLMDWLTVELQPLADGTMSDTNTSLSPHRFYRVHLLQ